MSNQKHKIGPAVKRYFLRLWAALWDRDLYYKEKKELEQRLNVATACQNELKEMYAASLDNWKAAKDSVWDLKHRNSALTNELSKCLEELSACRRLVETLREHPREKDKQLDAYAKGAHI